MQDNATFTDTDFSKTTDYYFYAGQLRRLQVQFASLFVEMQVSVGKNGNANRQTNLMTVPVKYASADRVVASIKAGNTQNVPLRLPMIALSMGELELAYDRFKGLKQVTRKVTFPTGAILPDGGKVVYKVTPMPYYVNFEMTVMTTNQRQMHEILEQIMILFTPDIQIQTSDAFLDWTAITAVELMGINPDTLPEDADNRVYRTSLQFRAVAYLSPPADIRENYIKRIKLRFTAIGTGESFDEFFMDDEAPYETVADVNTLDIPPR